MFFKKKQHSRVELKFNKDQLDRYAAEICDRLHLYKDEDGMKDLRELIQLSKNAAVLDCAGAKDENELIRFKAKVESFSELQHLVESSLHAKKLEAKEGKKQVKGTVNLYRRGSSQAGSAI